MVPRYIVVVLSIVLVSSGGTVVSGLDLTIDNKIEGFHMDDTILLEGRSSGTNDTWQ